MVHDVKLNQRFSNGVFQHPLYTRCTRWPWSKKLSNVGFWANHLKKCTYIRPLLEYSDTVWDNYNTLESKKLLDAVHVETAWIVTGATKLCSIEILFMPLGWESFQTRRNQHKHITFYKIMRGIAPNYISDLIPHIVGQTNNYTLRNADYIQRFRSNSNLFSEVFFFPSTIKAWSSLPNGGVVILAKVPFLGRMIECW